MNIETEERLDLGYDLGVVSSVNQRSNRMPKVIASVVQNESDFNFYRSWKIGTRNISREKIGKLHAFYLARKGTVQHFRFKDWADFSADYDGVHEFGYLGVGDGGLVQFQLTKRYISGDIHSRVIKKIVSGSVSIYFDEVLQGAGWSVNELTGRVDFSAAPAVGVVIKASFEFDVMAKFTSTDFSSKFLAYQNKQVSIHNMPALELKEL